MGIFYNDIPTDIPNNDNKKLWKYLKLAPIKHMAFTGNIFDISKFFTKQLKAPLKLAKTLKKYSFYLILLFDKQVKTLSLEEKKIVKVGLLTSAE